MNQDTQELTLVEKRGKLWFKREDSFEIAGVRGGKARTCYLLSRDVNTGLITGGSRHSPQVNIVAHVAKYLNLPCRIHTPRGELLPELKDAISCGAEHVSHIVGYNNVIIARAREDSRKRGWKEIPFGMECQEAVDSTADQIANIPGIVDRIVVSVGSGMTLAGILAGLKKYQRQIRVLGIVVGADPIKRLNRWAPLHWKNMVKLVHSRLSYHQSVPNAKLHGIILDPIYEAKCIPYLRSGDCLWIVGIRRTVAV